MSAIDRTALCAIEQYARHDACLPPFPADALRFGFTHPETDAEPQPMTVLKVVATDKVRGELLPRANDTWLAMLPFDDLDKRVSDAVKHDLIQKRRGLVEILATVARAGAPSLRLDASASMRFTDELTADPPGASKKTFWFDLMRALYPEASRVKTEEMARCLIAMSHTRSLRFLFCVSQRIVPADFLDILEKLLTSSVDTAIVEATSNVLAACGVKSDSVGRFTVEIGLSFTTAKISPSFLTKLFDVLDRCAQRNGTDLGVIGFNVTTLRFGCECVFQGKALDVLGQRKTLSTIADIRVGDLQNAKPGSLRLGMRGVLSQQRGLRRLVTTSLDGFKAVASTLRSIESHVEELDIVFEPTVENAAWLAFALFHVDSKSSVSSLRLRSPPNRQARQWPHVQTGTQARDWLTAFKQALRSITADQDLACLEDGDEHEGGGNDSSSRRFVTIKVGTAVKAEPYTSAKLLCKVEDHEKTFEAIATVDKSVAMIVPGVGIGWVSNASVTSDHFVTSRLAPTGSESFRINRKIKSLVWDSDFAWCSQLSLQGLAKGILEILQIVGEPLQSLHVPSLSISNAQLAQLLSFCPNLTDLNVCGHAMTSIAPLVDAYTSGSCKIHTLNLVSPGAFRPADTFPRELDTILQGAHGHTIQRLAVHATPAASVSSAVTRHREDVLALARTISTSRTLSFVKIPGSISSFMPFGMGGGDDLSAPPTKLGVDISSHPFCVAPVAMTTKLAFLSCLQRQDESSALRHLDACVVAVIFRFSGQLVARHVVLDAPVSFGGFGSF